MGRMCVGCWQETDRELCPYCSKPTVDYPQPPSAKSSPMFKVLAILNFLNAACPAFISLELLISRQRLENRWAIFVGLAAAGMLGLAVCLLVSPKWARAAAGIAVLLLIVHAAMLLPLAASDKHGMGGGVLVLLGAIGTCLFGMVPVATLLVTLFRKG